jgi:hypothetical protein
MHIRTMVGMRARVFLRRGRLDALLAAGADPSWDPELGLRAAQLSAPGRRWALAGGLERVVWDARRPPRWDCRAPVDRRAVRAASSELSALAFELAVVTAPSAQGIALASQLLCHPDSPLYATGGGPALRAGAVLAREALLSRDVCSSGNGNNIPPA